jgi:hypothetical protein
MDHVPWPVAVYLIHEASLLGLLEGAFEVDLLVPMITVAAEGQIEVGMRGRGGVVISHLRICEYEDSLFCGPGGCEEDVLIGCEASN